MIAVSDRFAMTFRLSGGQAHDAPEGRDLLEAWGGLGRKVPMIMDRAYEGDETRQLVLDLGLDPVVPAKTNRLVKWHYTHNTRKPECYEYIFFYDPSTYPKSAYHFSGRWTI